jgi:5-oxoprolinase (ATP-hydrolysing) subunit A
MRTIDLNADVGEVEGDLAVLPFVTSANIACGVHAGDEATMAEAAKLARSLGLAVGAHTGYPDREHMGRHALTLPLDEVRNLVCDQVEALAAIAGELTHVKPHGALYSQAAVNPVLAAAIAIGVRDAGPKLLVIGLAGSVLIEAARAADLPVAAEAFADRAYLGDGTLAPRGERGAVITNPAVAAAQAVAIARSKPVTAIDGTKIVVRADTICIHGDTPGAADVARAIRAALDDAGIKVAAVAP